MLHSVGRKKEFPFQTIRPSMKISRGIQRTESLVKTVASWWKHHEMHRSMANDVQVLYDKRLGDGTYGEVAKRAKDGFKDSEEPAGIEKVRGLEDEEQRDLAKGVLFSKKLASIFQPSLQFVPGYETSAMFFSRFCVCHDWSFLEYLQVEAYVNDLVSENCPEVNQSAKRESALIRFQVAAPYLGKMHKGGKFLQGETLEDILIRCDEIYRYLTKYGGNDGDGTDHGNVSLTVFAR
eukprot:755437-Hanusia_phi.AAC.2